MALALEVTDLLKLSTDAPVIDVRTPMEFNKGHIPGAINIPLFDDQSHASVGVSYRFQGRRAAILQGLDIVGPRLRALSEQLAYYAIDNRLLLYCARGGMRSQSMAWLASLNGYETYTLEGGYKQFRQVILSSYATPTSLIVLGGYSGSGKTEILHALERDAHQVVDLEGLARHKGSAFGGLGQPSQPTQQQFENELGVKWLGFDRSRPVWLENESRQIGELRLAEDLKYQMAQAPTLVLEVPLDLRVERLVTEYGMHSNTSLETAIRQVRKRLGSYHTQKALSALSRGDQQTCCRILLRHYYDKTYNRYLDEKTLGQIRYVRLQSLDVTENVNAVLHAGLLETVSSTATVQQPQDLAIY